MGLYNVGFLFIVWGGDGSNSLASFSVHWQGFGIRLCLICVGAFYAFYGFSDNVSQVQYPVYEYAVTTGLFGRLARVLAMSFVDEREDQTHMVRYRMIMLTFCHDTQSSPMQVTRLQVDLSRRCSPWCLHHAINLRFKRGENWSAKPWSIRSRRPRGEELADERCAIALTAQPVRDTNVVPYARGVEVGSQGCDMPHTQPNPTDHLHKAGGILD